MAKFTSSWRRVQYIYLCDQKVAPNRHLDGGCNTFRFGGHVGNNKTTCPPGCPETSIFAFRGIHEAKVARWTQSIYMLHGASLFQHEPSTAVCGRRTGHNQGDRHSARGHTVCYSSTQKPQQKLASHPQRMFSRFIHSTPSFLLEPTHHTRARKKCTSYKPASDTSWLSRKKHAILAITLLFLLTPPEQHEQTKASLLCVLITSLIR